MRIKLSPLASQVRGRHGGTVYTKSRGSETIRRFKSPVNTQSVARTHARAAFANLQRIYSSLYAPLTTSIEDYPRLGAVTPRNWFIALNYAQCRGQGSTRYLHTMPPHHPGLAPINWFAWPEYPLHVASWVYPSDPSGWTYLGILMWAVKTRDLRVNDRTYDWDVSIQYFDYKPTSPEGWGVIRYNGEGYQRGGQIHWRDPDGVEWYSESVIQYGA